MPHLGSWRLLLNPGVHTTSGVTDKLRLELFRFDIIVFNVVQTLRGCDKSTMQWLDDTFLKGFINVLNFITVKNANSLYFDDLEKRWCDEQCVKTIRLLKEIWKRQNKTCA